MALWKCLPARAQLLPGPLAAVAAATLITMASGPPVGRVEVGGLLQPCNPCNSLMSGSWPPSAS
ncbi:hypothetical protein [Streptomyces sp. ITFR-16]|uniref:hypothetical protein n=1 Tax=Streptomyces sp. ITFR-16 TaxID=3075198 RepID=UPI00288B2B21|nr:hypothetical protein [Streptomyces sp. ITFR-16]WNI26127.1 hypothetical protein RLT58_31495 [Streptomyces sp. ITFR-16]